MSHPRKVTSKSRIPSPTRTPASITRRGSQTSTPQRSRSSSTSPSRAAVTSPAFSSRSLENLSPIRPVDIHKSRSAEVQTVSGKNLVRYITTEMIKKLAKEEQLEHIKNLNFILSGEKKIRYIENLDGLKNLVSLNFSGNTIGRIEKLDHLTNLRHLNLSNNKIEKIEGLETLVSLQVLNLEMNLIEKIPLWVAKKLRSLRTVKLALNSISSLTEVVRLRGLHDLHLLTIEGNPLCDLPHYRSYIIFHLRILNHLDDVRVTSTERSDATARFSQEELDRLSRELQNTTNQLMQTKELQNKSIEDLDEMRAREKETEEREHRGLESREELERQLDAKDELLKRKAKELQRAQAKHYQLEQELAFMKLDAKFQPLELPHMNGDDDADSPYLGKSRFKRNEFAMEGHLPASKMQLKYSDDHSRQELDEQLAEKQRQLNEAAERLAALQRELRDTEDQVIEASRELDKLEQAATARRFTEAEKQKIRQRLAAKIQKINQMKEDAETIEADLARSRTLIPSIRMDQDDLRTRMASLDPNSPEYAHCRGELSNKESQVQNLTKKIKENEAILERLLKNIAVDTDEIKELEEQLERGSGYPNDALRRELEDIVRGLQDYLLNVKRKADAQRAEFDNLLREKERLVRRLAALEQEKSMLMADADDYSQLQQQISVLGELNELLQANQDLNESILKQRSMHVPPCDEEVLPPHLHDVITSGKASSKEIEEATRITLDALNKSMADMQELNSALQDEATHLSKHDSELQTQLQEAQKKIESLQRSMQESDRKSHSAREKLDKQMEEVAKLQNVVGDRESEAAALRKEVGKLKDHNQNLNHELSARTKQHNKELSALLQPHEVAKRLSQVGEALKKGDRAALELSRDGGPFQNALKNLGNILFNLLEKENESKEKAEKALDSLERHMDNLKKKLVEAQKEYKETMEAATAAKIEGEKKKHEDALRYLDQEMAQMKERLRQAEEDAELMRALAENERSKKEEEIKAKDERSRLYNAKSQAAIRDLERELGVTRRDLRDKEAATNKELDENRAKIEGLHRKLKKLEEERDNTLLNTMDAETTAKKALDDLANAEEEIRALEDLLRAHEVEPEGGSGRNTIRRLRNTLASRQEEVDRLRRALSGRKLTPEQIDQLLCDLAALRDALSSNHRYIKTLWPGYYYVLPNGGKWVYTKHPPDDHPPHPPPPGISVPIQGAPINTSHSILQPGTPGITAVQDDGSYILVPFDNYYGNVPGYHDLEEENAQLRDALVRCKEKRKALKAEFKKTLKIVGPLEDAESRYEDLIKVINSHEDIIKKLKEDEELLAREKAEAAKELADLKDTLNHKLQRKHQLEERVEKLLGELRTEEAMLQSDEMREELESLDRTLSKRRMELRDAERTLKESRDGADHAEEKAEAMTNQFERAKSDLRLVKEDAEELEKQVTDTGAKLVRARKELWHLQEQIKEADSRKIQLDDQCRQLARLVTNKESEFTALEQKTDHMTGSLERLQSELILAEEKEAERLSVLRDSEKVLSERREEIGKLKEQALSQRDEVEGLDRLLGKKKTELQLLQENIEQHQTELSNVLKEGKADVQEKQKLIKQLRHDVDDLSTTKSDLETQISRRRGELVSVKENLEQLNEELQSRISQVNKSKSEMKHVLEMLALEQQELESLKRQHDTKSSELADIQHRLLEERTELDRMTSDVQRKENELSKVKQNVEKLRSDVDCLTSQRSTLEDTVTSLMKEKDLLSTSASNLEDKIKVGKKQLYEVRTGIDKSSSTLDELELELNQVRKEVCDLTQQKSSLNKETTAMTSIVSDLKSELTFHKSELQDTQEQLQLLDQDLRAATKQRDDVTMEVVALREELKSRGLEMELLNQQLKRKREDAHRAEETARLRRDELAEKEREIERLTRESERQEEKLSRTVADLNSDIQRLQRELSEQRDELESTIIKRDAVKRDMERLERLDGKYEETESHINILQEKLAEKENDLHNVLRDRADLKGSLASAEGELRASRVEADHEIKRLLGKLEDTRHEMEKIKTCSDEEINSLDKLNQEHSERGSRMAKEINQLRVDQIRLKKEIRFLEEEREKDRIQFQISARRIREEIDAKVEEGVNLLDSSHTEAVDDMNDLLQQRESNQKRLNALKEIQRSRPPAHPHPIRREDRMMQTLQEDLKAKQEEIASQIKKQMNKHREQWQAKKKQSEGKLNSLKKKVENLDELVSNTSIESLSHSRGRDLSPSRILPVLEERENVTPPERDFLGFS